MAINRDTRMIDAATFVESPVLSRGKQRYLKLMFKAVLDARRPVTLVAGAGISMNASLPSWECLIANMASFITDPDLRRMVDKDKSDPMRRAEIILHLVKVGNANPEEYEFVRDALYQKGRSVAPGQLAASIARLAATRKGNFRIITTNFDNILEQALWEQFDKAAVRSFSLDEVKEWTEWTGDDQVGVLHLHGLLRQGESPKHPIVLTESQFLKHGAKVRKTIANTLENSYAIFVGLSMADPNLVGPLYESASAMADAVGVATDGDGLIKSVKHDRFALVVPQSLPGEGYEDSAKYAVASAKYLESKLGLKPIFLKSYSQLNQVLSDLSLAIIEPHRYKDRPTDKSPSLVYGRRLTRALEECYAAIGCSSRQSIPTNEAAQTLSERLFEALHRPKGPVRILRNLRIRYNGKASAFEENFALYLWLRARSPGRRIDPPYSLSLVGTSAYVHRQDWSMRHEEDIVEDSDFAAVQAVFYGTPKAVNLDPSRNIRTWRGIVAAPIILADTSCSRRIGSYSADVLTIGAIALSSTHKVKPKKEHENVVATDTDRDDYSIISKLDSGDFNKLMTALQWSAEYVLSSQSP